MLSCPDSCLLRRKGAHLLPEGSQMGLFLAEAEGNACKMLLLHGVYNLNLLSTKLMRIFLLIHMGAGLNTWGDFGTRSSK